MTSAQAGLGDCRILRNLRGPLRRQAIIVGDRQRVVAGEHVDPRQSPPRAADEIERAAFAFGGEAAFPEALAEQGRGMLLAMPSSGSMRSTPSGSEMPRPARPSADFDQLEAAAAEVGDDAVGIGDRRQHAFAGQPGLFLRRRAARQSRPISSIAWTNSGPVAGVADGGGGDDLGLAHAHVAQQQLEPLEHGQRDVPRLAGDAAGCRRRRRRARQALSR